MFDIFRKIILIIGFIYTIPVLAIVYMKLDGYFFYKFILVYLVVLLLVGIVFIITLFSNIRKSKLKTILKLLLKFVVISFITWVLGVLFFYITKGELRLTDYISNCTMIGFILSFGPMLYEKQENI